MTDIAQPYVDTAIAAVNNLTDTPQGAADKIAEQCSQCAADPRWHAEPNADGNVERDLPGLENFLWSFWTEFVQLAARDANIHDRLAQILVALRAKGDRGCDGWRVWGQSTKWETLPLFGSVCREEMNGPMPTLPDPDALQQEDPRAQAILAGEPPSEDPAELDFAQGRNRWLNLNNFLAKLWAEDVWDGSFYGISTMRMQLEPLSLSSTRDPALAANEQSTEPPELEIEVATIWLRVAGAKMYASREIMGPKGNAEWAANRGAPGSSGGTWDGVDGYHPDRWAHWKQILLEVSQGSWRPHVIQAAQAAVNAMDRYEHENPSV